MEKRLPLFQSPQCNILTQTIRPRACQNLMRNGGWLLDCGLGQYLPIS